MSLTIKTNTSSLIAQNSLKTSTSKLNQAIERMSSGAKINHAKDNAANYSIATNYSTKLSALQVAEDNVNMGLDMLSTSSDVLSQMEDNISKIRALAVQAQNGTYGSKSLSAMNSEAKALMQEISRLNETAQYNGIKLFNTGKAEITNAGKELELNEQGFLQNVVVRDTSTMTKISDIDETQALAKGTYSISTVDDLLKLHRMSKSGLLVADSEYVLANDIDLKAYCKSQESNGGWTPISLSNCILDGNGYTISNLYINRPSEWYQGFLANASVNSVNNLRLENVDITANKYVGAFMGGYVGAFCGNYTNCSATGKIVASGDCVGGIIGTGYYSYVSFCYADLDITGANTVGGIYGYANYGSSLSCYFEGSVAGNKNVGGIIGNGIGNQCKVIANVTGKDCVGGISGYSYGSLDQNKESYFYGTVIGENSVGGILGSCNGASTISGVIMEGEVLGSGNAGIIAGSMLAGSAIDNAYYYGKNNSYLNLAGTVDNVKIKSATDIAIPTGYYLQVGTNSDSASSGITLTTYVDFSALTDILMTGIEDDSILEKIDELVNQVSLKQTEIGTAQNRLLGVLDEISTQYENLVSSRSTIMDADMAEVSSEYIRQQILQEASATLMATANQSPSIALQLL